MRVLFWGKGSRAHACLRAILAAGFDVVGVVAQGEEKPGGDVPNLQQQADAHDLPLYIPGKLRSSETLDRLRQFNADLFVMAGFSRILPPDVINMPSMGVVNLHGAKLPEYRGTAAIPWQIIMGERELGLTILYATDGIDEGDILMAETYPLSAEQGATDAVVHANKRFPEMLVDVLGGLREGTLKGVPQDLSEGSYYTKRRPEDGLIDCRLMTAEQIFNMIRALTAPYPGAFAYHNGGEKVVLQRAQLLGQRIHGVPGTIPLKRDGGVILVAQDRGLLLTEVRDGNNIIPAHEVFKVGDRLLPYRDN